VNRVYEIVFTPVNTISGQRAKREKFTGDQKRFRNNRVRLARTATRATQGVDAADPGGGVNA
jgi:hypothetical protein